MNATSIDPALVPQRTLYTGARMPAIGLGTFGCDHVSAGEIAEAVKGAAAIGYRHFDCAAVYRQRGPHRPRVARQSWRAASPREELWVTSQALERQARGRRRDPRRAANRSPTCNSITWTCTWSTGRFRISIRPGCDVESRSPDAGPTSTRTSCGRGARWKSWSISGWCGTSAPQHDHPEAGTAAARCAHPAGRQRNGTAPALPAAGAVRVRASRTGSSPIGYSPDRLAGTSRTRPNAGGHGGYRRSRDRRIAERLGVHPAVVCVKWAVQRGADSDSVFHASARNYLANLQGAVSEPLTAEEMPRSPASTATAA